MSSSAVMLNMPLLSLLSPHPSTDDTEELSVTDQPTTVSLDETRRSATDDGVQEDSRGGSFSLDQQVSSVNRDSDSAHCHGSSPARRVDPGLSQDIRRRNPQCDSGDAHWLNFRSVIGVFRRREEPPPNSRSHLVPVKPLQF